jgi:hypothetical protein
MSWAEQIIENKNSNKKFFFQHDFFKIYDM